MSFGLAMGSLPSTTSGKVGWPTKFGVAASRSTATPTFEPRVVDSSVPGLSGMAESASSVVKNLLSGLPGTSIARRANAYFGAASGMPGSDFVRNRGFDLYNMQGEARQQQGISNLLQLLSGFSQPKLSERSQDIAQNQYATNLQQGQLEADRDYGLRQKQVKRLYPTGQTNWMFAPR